MTKHHALAPFWEDRLKVLGAGFLIHVLLLASFAAAQTRSPLAPDSAVGAAVARLRPGTTIRFNAANVGRVEGRFAGASAATLTLADSGPPADYAIAAIDSVWVRGTAARRGALIGAIPVGLFGIAVGVGANSGACGESSGSCPWAIPVLGLAGAAAGALLGALVGSQIPRWHRRVP